MQRSIRNMSAISLQVSIFSLQILNSDVSLFSDEGSVLFLVAVLVVLLLIVVVLQM